MIGVFINLTIYTAGLLALVAANFLTAMKFGFTDDAAVLTLQIASPVILWAQVFAYDYLFEGCELLSARILDHLATLRSRILRTRHSRRRIRTLLSYRRTFGRRGRPV